MAVTRGMFITVLGRLANAQAQPNDKFRDVDKTAYYAGFIAWANEMGIVNGISNEEFAPDNEITREQLAVIIYNYAKAVGMDISNTDPNKKDQLKDTDTISEWAENAISYCINQGLLSGRTDGSFDSKGKASRAEVATVLQKFVEIIK